MAAVPEHVPRTVQPVLPPGQPRLRRPDVLEEQKAPSGAQHPGHLGHDGIGVWRAAQHHREGNGVELAVGEGEVLARRLDHIDGTLPAGHLLAQLVGHRAEGL